MTTTLCKRCGYEVEESRRHYATPVCFSCLPPPTPLPVVWLSSTRRRVLEILAERPHTLIEVEQALHGACHDLLLKMASEIVPTVTVTPIGTRGTFDAYAITAAGRAALGAMLDTGGMVK